MEGRLIEYRPIGGGLDYHHNSPLIGEIPPAGGDYSHAVHRSIDHLRNSLNERVALGPLSVFSNTADLRSSVLSYSQQPHQPHHQPPPQQQQHQQQHQQQQHQYHLSGGGVEPLVQQPKPSLTTLESSGVPSSAVTGSNSQKHVNDAVVSSSSGGGSSTATGSAPTGSTRGRKSRIYPNPNQHIIVTSNSVDNGGIRMQNATINERNGQNTGGVPVAGVAGVPGAPVISGGGVVPTAAASGNGISSSTSSPHHMTQMDVKDTK
ncbi:Hypothetical predicted protein, partial [Drosophila guanche]